MIETLLQADPAAQGGGMGSLLLLVGIMVIFFIFMIRPQMKKQKEEQKFRDGLQKGDSVVTIGGLYGKIVEIKGDNTVLLEIAKDVVIKISKSALLKDQAALSEQQK
ncbi:MAG: preprotein translocase subunit YajC [Bacteroidales bacterium]|nr:preprotein translocase subunit YajC [Bacteroidales bacterium]MBP5723565.1 preprotein translocase subunit YajC [Bacteroidales bacterium]MBQ3677739.1 preprotein translocase subunit YajC [Bacteroidales bacterium]MBQ4216029.1 preprotein translocase subunit YajC [Bacteroidales bacterium]MBR4498788.1 preprotein translocase subunit YajC [Bacteroidales bacterium]